MIPNIIALAVITSLLTLIIRIIVSRRPFWIRKPWHQLIISMLIGAILWALSILLMGYINVPSDSAWGDILCGILIFFCAFWCNYWSGNLAGGFRVQMQFDIAEQNIPISLEKWMKIFGGLGMEVFLKDRIESILIPWNTVALENGQLRLLPGRGTFFGRLAGILKKIIPIRSND